LELPVVTMAVRIAASTASPVATWILVALGGLWFLRAARTVLIPIALAVLISYALEPVVAWLERWRVNRVFASAVVLLTVLGGVIAGGYAVKDDATRLVEALPKAAERARGIVTSQLGSTAEMLGANDRESSLGRGSGEAKSTSTAGSMTGSLLERAVSGIFAFAGHLVVIVFLVFFLLMSGRPARTRIVEIFIGPYADDRRTTATIVNEIDRHIQRYLLVLLFTGAVVGASTWLVLAWIGAEHAAMWGLLAGVFNSIPYFGPVVVSGGLFVVGIAQGGGVTQALQMSGAAIVITSLEGWLLTPALMGKVERMNALAVFIGLMLWTWLWGAWGTVLAVPMLVVMKSIADHVRPLRSLGRLLAA
jgi:predicted PurR-regulated permease PerM